MTDVNKGIVVVGGGRSGPLDLVVIVGGASYMPVFDDFATILHHYFATSASFQKSRKHPPAALLLLNFNLPKI